MGVDSDRFHSQLVGSSEDSDGDFLNARSIEL